MMARRIFKLRTPTIAILPENNRRIVMTIPANAVVTLMVGNIDKDGFVHIRYRNQCLVMLAIDLRSRGERLLEETA
jgi:hypothetical protein